MFAKIIQARGVRVYTVRSQWVHLSSPTSQLGPLLSPRRWPISLLLVPRPSWCVASLDPATLAGGAVDGLLRGTAYTAARFAVNCRVGCREEGTRWLPSSRWDSARPCPTCPQVVARASSCWRAKSCLAWRPSTRRIGTTRYRARLVVRDPDRLSSFNQLHCQRQGSEQPHFRSRWSLLCRRTVRPCPPTS